MGGRLSARPCRRAERTAQKILPDVVIRGEKFFLKKMPVKRCQRAPADRNEILPGLENVGRKTGCALDRRKRLRLKGGHRNKRSRRTSIRRTRKAVASVEATADPVSIIDGRTKIATLL